MKEIEVYLDLSSNPVSFLAENDERFYFDQLDDYYDLSSLDAIELTLIGYALNGVIYCLKDPNSKQELPKKNSKSYIDIIKLDVAQNKHVTVNSKFKIPRNYDLSKADLDQLFYLEFKGKTLLKLEQDKRSVSKLNPEKVIREEYMFLKAYLETERSSSSLTDRFEKELEKDDLALLKVGFNYNDKPLLLDNKKVLKGYRLPIDTYELIRNKGCKIDNFHLQFYRYPKLGEPEGNKYKISETHTPSLSKDAYPYSFFTNLNQRHQITAKTLHPSTTCWLQTTKTRLIAGMGNASVYENGITLHHLYGIPYLPASSIKGLLRSWVLQCCFKTAEMKSNNQLEQAAMKDPLFIRLFGGIYKQNKEIHKEEAKQGDLIVWDAFPTKKPKVEVDIIANHYEYKENAKHASAMPQAKEKLNLVKFLTVAAGVPFQWLLSERQPIKEVLKTNSPIWTKLVAADLIDEQVTSMPLVELAKYWLVDALQQHGIGAKTAIGHGLFEALDSKV